MQIFGCFKKLGHYPSNYPKTWSWPEGYDVHLHTAEKKGYSGVATLSRIPMEVIQTGKPSKVDPEDKEGRIVVTKHDGLTCINTYLPSGSSGEERQQLKETWMNEWREFLLPYLSSNEPVSFVATLMSLIQRMIFGIQKVMLR